MSLVEERLRPGHILDGRYRIAQLICAGGMGAVYRAEDLKLNQKVCAIKEMLESFESPGERQAAIDRFLSEVAVMETLKHANIPRVTDHFVENNKYYFVMEFIEGVDLQTLLEREGAPGLEPERVLTWAVQVCDALEYLHSQKPPIVHRDLKPSNLILRDTDGRILLIDFGIARVTNPQAGWIGTPGYAPPEQQCGKHEPSSDLFALGATVHELLTGQKPDDFYFKSFEEMGITHIPAGVWEVLVSALQTFTDERYPNARAMRSDLVGALGYEPDIAHDASFAFNESVARLKDSVLDPSLRQLITRYGNDCQTPFLPRMLERLVFTLGSSTPFKLIMQANEAAGTVDFFEQQGILDQSLLGAVRPDDAEAGRQASEILDRFVRDYESFKNSNWGF
ncbi:MAG: serine/threonine protein kinase [Armatimonadetes bacterium]|nr:serine/threonine protein kinase [Armatimonadota bacterium]